ncbi:MAG: ZIP family metal transporter [Clostridia bacterium]|nr:ZIP family metal transporter [Clostridia bacterium]MBQ5809076.1 ZIP family metal transporter [Clostridia bacterium]
MEIVALTAIGVGGATVIGAVCGFLFKSTAQRYGGIVLAFASGVMLASAVLGLIIPSVEYGGRFGAFVAVFGIFVGAFTISALDGLVPQLQALLCGNGVGEGKQSKGIILVLAIAIHNLPEGIAAGVGFGSGDTASALFIAGGIALQNLPEGMVIISPMLLAGIPPRRAFFIASITGAVEVAGTFIGYFAVSVASILLPFALAFAGGTMLFVICDDMIFENNTEGSRRASVYALLAGFSLMLLF